MSELIVERFAPARSAHPEPIHAQASQPAPIELYSSQLESLSRQVKRLTLPALICAAMLVYCMLGHAATWQIAALGTCFCAIAIAHRSMASHWLRKSPPCALRALHINLLLVIAAAGAIAGTSAFVFQHLQLPRQALLTIVVMCWSAIVFRITSGYARAFYAHILTALTPVIVLWASSGSSDDTLIAILIGMFGALLALLARDAERSLRASLEAQRVHAQLVEEIARERYQAGLARQHAQNAERAKSRFLCAASHDLRQPLHALSLYSAAMQLRRPDSAMAQIGQNIDEAVGSLSTLVDSLLEVSRLDAGATKAKLQHIDLKLFLEHLAAQIRPLVQARGLELQLSICEAEIETDSVLLERLLRHLLDNAIKYTRTGAVAIIAEIDDGDVRIAVRDTGPGIPIEERNRIFEEFYQIGNSERDRAQGLGLGLAIARRLAALLRASIELESAPGEGSTFAVRLARAGRRKPASLAAHSADAPARSLAGASFLVIDDEPAVRASMGSLFDSWGCNVALCSGLEDARRVLMDERFDADVIISDLRLRQGENGIDTVRELRTLAGPIPALLITGEASVQRLREAHASGLPLLHKPVSVTRLREALLELLREKKATKA